jgi:hypothetical protein
MWVVTQYLLNLILSTLTKHAVAGPFSGALDGAYVGLFITPTQPMLPTQGISSITEATYDGYARLPLTWYPPYLDPAQVPTIESAGAHFVPTGSVVANQITGVFVSDAVVAGNLLMSCFLPMPGRQMAGVLNAMTVAALFQFGVANYGGPTIID